MKYAKIRSLQVRLAKAYIPNDRARSWSLTLKQLFSNPTMTLVLSIGVLVLIFCSLQTKARSDLLVETAVAATTTIFTRTQTIGQSASFGVDLGDVDDDGDLDAFTANVLFEASPSNANEVWLNDGTGQFTNRRQWDLAQSAQQRWKFECHAQ